MTRIPLSGIGIVTVLAGLLVGVPTASADTDYGYLLIDPNPVTDSAAYSAPNPPTPDADGRPGTSTVFVHRDGSRTLTDTIAVLPDVAAAQVALDEAKAALPATVAAGRPEPAAVGTGGTIVAGTSPDGSRAVTVLYFTEANAFATLEFEGAANDPVPTDLAVELGQAQAQAIKDRLH